MYPIKCEKIIYAQADNRAISIYLLDDKSYTLRYRSMTRLLEEADCRYLLRCSRSTAVNINYIKSIDITSRYITMITGDMIDIGITYVDRVKKLVMNGDRI